MDIIKSGHSLRGMAARRCMMFLYLFSVEKARKIIPDASFRKTQVERFRRLNRTMMEHTAHMINIVGSYQLHNRRCMAQRMELHRIIASSHRSLFKELREPFRT